MAGRGAYVHKSYAIQVFVCEARVGLRVAGGSRSIKVQKLFGSTRSPWSVVVVG